jgi:alkanesulfonate monooxygenase SsuD/methylene tetrahydromethanopterin reductase-like flavin-dependent oxidoreductase (luciferase family)
MTPPVPNRSPLVLVTMARSTLAQLLAPHRAAELPRLGRVLDTVADAVVLGADLVQGQDAGEAGVDPTIAAIALAHHTHRVGLVVAAVPQRDHPYNLARRLASLDYASNGRAGLLIGAHDRRAAAGSPWTSADPVTAAADAVTAIRALWRSFPVDAIVADRESGVFAESHRIVAIDHRGAFNVTGPSQIPWSPQIWPPVLAWASGPVALADVADVVIDPADSRVSVHRADGIAQLERLLSTAPRSLPSPPSLRARFGLAAVNPPTHGRQVFPNPAPNPASGLAEEQKVVLHAR